MLIFLSIVAVVVIVSLSLYAMKLTQKVKEQDLQQKEIEARYEQKKNEQQAYIVESLQVISASALAQELNLSEATIRCKMLLEGLDLPEQEREPYSVLEEVYHHLKNFDTHEARKKLSPAQRKQQDKERVAIEQKYKPELLSCFGLLKQFKI